MAPFLYSHLNFLLCAALHLPRPLSKKCIKLAVQLEKAAKGSDEQAVRLAQLEQDAAWNEWTRVAQTYLLLGGKSNTPRKFFIYWRKVLFGKLTNDAHRRQYR